MDEQQPDDNVPPQMHSESQQSVDGELAFPHLKPGDAWGESITKERVAELEAILQKWKAEKEHGERKGPFHHTRLVGADVFWLAEHSRQDAAGRLSNLHLEGADLGEAHLEHAQLGEAHLEYADLMGANLQDAELIMTNLHGASLLGARMESAGLLSTHLQNADLTAVRLDRAILIGAILEGAILDEARLDGANLTLAHLEGVSARGAFLDDTTRLDEVVLGNDELGYIALADVRWRNANLTVVDWTCTRSGFLGIGKRIEAIELGDVRTARKPTNWVGKPKSSDEWVVGFKVAVRANRQLATVLRQQGLNEDADRFAYKAQILQREVLRRQGNVGGYAFSLLLWALSGYGYRLWRIFLAYALVLLTFATIYVMVGLPDQQGLSAIQAFANAVQVSLTAIHGRVFFEQFGIGSMLAWVAAVESVVGIVIEGVFVAMLIQRFFAR